MLLSFAADIISCVEFNHDGELLATGDKGGRVVIFQRDQVVSVNVVSVRKPCEVLTPVLLFLLIQIMSYFFI